MASLPYATTSLAQEVAMVIVVWQPAVGNGNAALALSSGVAAEADKLTGSFPHASVGQACGDARGGTQCCRIFWSNRPQAPKHLQTQEPWTP